MSGQFRVQPESLGSAGQQLQDAAVACGDVDLTGPCGRASSSVPAADTAAQAARVGNELAATVRGLSAAIRLMGAAAGLSAGNYVSADGVSASTFTAIGSVLPAGVLTGPLLGPGLPVPGAGP